MTMNVEEARAWLAGDRSWCNAIPSQQYGEHIAITAVADASTTHQAYWIVKAHDDAGRLRADRLERAAVAAMQGMCANTAIIGPNPSCGWSYTNCDAQQVAAVAMVQARALLAELDKSQEQV